MSGLKVYRRKHSVRTRDTDSNDEVQEDEDEDSDELAKRDMDELRTTVISERTIVHVKRLIERTIKYRSKIAVDPSMDLKQLFPFFYARPDLVCLTMQLFSNVLNLNKYIICINFRSTMTSRGASRR